MSICHIVFPKNLQKKLQKDKNNFWEKIFFGPLSLLNKFRADLHMGEKGEMTNREGTVLRAVFCHTN